MTRDRVLLRHFLVYIVLTTVAIAQPILQLYGDNLTIFVSSRISGWQVLLFGLVIILLPPLLMSLGEVVIGSIFARQRKHAHNFFVFIGLWLIVLLLLRSVSFGAWPVALCITAVLALGLLRVYVNWNAVGSWVRLMSPLSLVVMAMFAISVKDVVWVADIGAADVVINKGPTTAATPRADVSVVMVILDEAPLFPLLNADGKINSSRFPGFASLANSSTWYRNDVASSQYTTSAVPSILTGVLPIRAPAPLVVNYPKNLFTLLGGNMAMDVQEIMTSLCPKQLCEKAAVSPSDDTTPEDNNSPEDADIDQAKETSEFGRFLRDTSIVLGHKLLPEGLRQHLPTIDEAWGNFGGAKNNADQTSSADSTVAPDELSQESSSLPSIQYESTETMKESKLKWRSGGPVSQVLRVETLTKRATEQAIPTLHFAHVLLPHRPWNLTSDGRSSAKPNYDQDNPKEIDASRDQYQKFLHQYAATDKIIGDLVAKLRASKNWDRTMLIVTADHGITFEPSEHKRDTNATRIDTMEDLYRVPLFIKYPDQTVFEANDCPVMAVDILPTISAVKGIDAGWKYDGQSLLNNCPQRQARTITWLTGRTELISSVESLQKRAVKYDQWVSFNSGVDGISGIVPYESLMKAPVETTIARETRISKWSLEQAEKFDNISGDRFADIPIALKGSITFTSKMSSDAVGLVLVDGRVAGMIGEVSSAKAGSKVSFLSIIASSSLTPGPHQVALAIATGNPSSPTITYVGSPS